MYNVDKDVLVSLVAGSEEMAACKNEMVADGRRHKPTGDDVYSKKRPLILHDEFSKPKRHKNKHIYFDDDGNEIIECDMVFTVLKYVNRD